MTLITASRVQCHVRDLIAVIRNLMAGSCPHTTACRRVAMLWRTRAAVSATFILASRAQRRVHDSIAIVRILIVVARLRTTSCRRVAALWRIRDAVSATFMGSE